MKLKHVLLAAGAAALLGWGGCRLLAPSPEARVRAAFSDLAACLDKRGADEGPLRTLAKREELAGLLDDTVTVTVRERGWTGTRTPENGWRAGGTAGSRSGSCTSRRPGRGPCWASSG